MSFGKTFIQWRMSVMISPRSLTIPLSNRPTVPQPGGLLQCLNAALESLGQRLGTDTRKRACRNVMYLVTGLSKSNVLSHRLDEIGYTKSQSSPNWMYLVTGFAKSDVLSHRLVEIGCT